MKYLVFLLAVSAAYSSQYVECYEIESGIEYNKKYIINILDASRPSSISVFRRNLDNSFSVERSFFELQDEGQGTRKYLFESDSTEQIMKLPQNIFGASVSDFAAHLALASNPSSLEELACFTSFHSDIEKL